MPTFRPDTEREIDVIEEVARHHGYAQPAPARARRPPGGRPDARTNASGAWSARCWPASGAHEAWTPSLLGPDEHARVGIDGGVAGREPAHPRRESCCAGACCRDAAGARLQRRPSAGRRPAVRGGPRLPAARRRAGGTGLGPSGRDAWSTSARCSAWRWPAEGDDARVAAAAWHVLADAFGVDGVESSSPPPTVPTARRRCLRGCTPPVGARRRVGPAPACRPAPVGVVGEVDPGVLEDFGLDATRAGWGGSRWTSGVLLGEAPRRTRWWPR